MQVVTLAAAAACAHQHGVAELLFGHCPAMADMGSVSLFRPWTALHSLKVIGICFSEMVESQAETYASCNRIVPEKRLRLKESA